MNRPTKLKYFYYYHLTAYLTLIVNLYGQYFASEGGFLSEMFQLLHLFLAVITLLINFISFAMVFFGSASFLSITLIQIVFFCNKSNGF